MKATPDSRRDRLRAQLFFVVTRPACAARACQPPASRRAVWSRVASLGAFSASGLVAGCWGPEAQPQCHAQSTPSRLPSPRHPVSSATLGRLPASLAAPSKHVRDIRCFCTGVAGTQKRCDHRSAGLSSPCPPSRSLQSGRRYLRRQACQAARGIEQLRLFRDIF